MNDFPGFIQGVNQSWHHHHACTSLLLPVQHRYRWSYISVEATTWTYRLPSIHSTGICKAPTLCRPCPGPGDTWHTGQMWDLCSGSWPNSRKNYQALCLLFSASSLLGGTIIFSILYVFGSSDAKAHSLNQWTPNTSEHALLSVRKLSVLTCVCT